MASGDDFLNTYGPYAAQVGQQLGVDPTTILNQWRLESGSGTSQAARTGFNLAGIGGEGNLRRYNSPADFATDYTNIMKANFPKVLNTGTDTVAFNNGLINGRVGKYYTGDPNAYLAALQGRPGQTPPVAGPPPAPGANAPQVNLGDVFQQQLQRLQLQRAILNQPQGPPPMAFGLTPGGGSPLVDQLNRAAQAFKMTGQGGPLG